MSILLFLLLLLLLLFLFWYLQEIRKEQDPFYYIATMRHHVGHTGLTICSSSLYHNIKSGDDDIQFLYKELYMESSCQE
ncbi:hypothetical protein F4703DRAFT_1867124 [Phycomyces blakesleeanus]